MAISFEPGVRVPLASEGNSDANKRRRQNWAVMAALVVFDSLALLVTFELVYLLRFQALGFLYVPENSPLEFYSSLVLFLIPSWIVVFASYRLYDLRVLHGGTDEYRRISQACGVSTIVLLALSFFLDEKLIISRAWLLMVLAFSIGTLSLTRFIARRILYKLRPLGIARTRVLIIGANNESRELAWQLVNGRNSPGLEIVGFIGERRVDTRHFTNNDDIALRNVDHKWPAKWMGLLEDTRTVVEQYQIDEVFIIGTALAPQELYEVVRQLTTTKVEIRLSPSLYEILTTGMEIQEINGLPLVMVNKVRITGLNAVIKRVADIGLSLAVLTVFALFLPLLAYRLKKDSPGPVFYRRKVVGQGGKLFNAYKLRTMHTNGNEILAARPDLILELQETGKLKDDPRITGLGKFLRKTSIDEIPQLINVLLGQMSLVGPRMITEDEMSKFGRWQSNLMTVKPGLTGLWQVSGRSNLSYEDRVRLDMQYIRNYSLWSDISIMFQTVFVVLRGTGAY